MATQGDLHFWQTRQQAITRRIQEQIDAGRAPAQYMVDALHGVIGLEYQLRAQLGRQHVA